LDGGWIPACSAAFLFKKLCQPMEKIKYVGWGTIELKNPTR